jgi:hypothetical protein
MKNTELRIGNFVHYQINDKFDKREQWNEVIKIEAIDFECFDKYYLPIELTEEWLLKLRFYTGIDKRFDKGNIWLIDTIEYIYILRKSKLDNHFNLYKLDNFSQKEYPIKYVIKYVHELQNLYFCLTTGEELQVKL